jgi:putative ABC transport system permease protein
VEGWAYARSELLTENDKGGDAVQLMGPPVNSTLIQPMLLKGRWILPGDRNAIVLSERFLSAYPHLQVGDTLRLRVNGDKTDWVVVGFFQLAGKSAGFVAYTGYDYLASRIHEPNMAVTYRVTGDRASRGGKDLTMAEQRALGAKIEAYLQKRGFGVTEVQAGQSIITNSASGLNTLTTFLLVMAFLTAIVGSIGLMGTMSMNVLDRTREIGVMRAIGASDRAVMNMVIVEGMLIGLISWVLGTILAVPISKVLSDTIHLAVFDARADFTFTVQGPLYWLGLVIILSILASVLPARSAARLTIREALAYE